MSHLEGTNWINYHGSSQVVFLCKVTLFSLLLFVFTSFSDLQLNVPPASLPNQGLMGKNAKHCLLTKENFKRVVLPTSF